MWQDVVFSIVKAPLSEGWRYSCWCIIQLEAFLSSCGTHSTYLCNTALCKMIKDVVWLYSNIGPFKWVIMEEYNLGGTLTMLLDVSLNYRYGLNSHQNRFCCHFESSNGQICGNVYCLHTFGNVESVCLFYDNFVTLTSTAFTATKVFQLPSLFPLCLNSIHFIIFLLQSFHYHPFI